MLSVLNRFMFFAVLSLAISSPNASFAARGSKKEKRKEYYQENDLGARPSVGADSERAKRKQERPIVNDSIITRYIGVGGTIGGGASKDQGSFIFSGLVRFGMGRIFNQDSRAPSFYLGGDVSLNLGLISYTHGNTYFAPSIGVVIKPGVAMGLWKVVQVYGIIGLENIFVATSDFHGFFVFDIGVGGKFSISKDIDIFAELKIAPTMVSYGSSTSIFPSGEPVFISVNAGVDFML